MTVSEIRIVVDGIFKPSAEPYFNILTQRKTDQCSVKATLKSNRPRDFDY